MTLYSLGLSGSYDLFEQRRLRLRFTVRLPILKVIVSESRILSPRVEPTSPLREPLETFGVVSVR